MTAAIDCGDVMKDTIGIKPYSSSSGMSPTYGATVTYSGVSVNRKIKNIPKPDGTNSISSAEITMSGAPAITKKDKVVLDGENWTILQIWPLKDETGAAYATIIYV